MRLRDLLCGRTIFVLAWLTLWSSAYAEDIKVAQLSTAEIEKLDTLYKSFSARFHHQLLQKNIVNAKVYAHVKELNSAVALLRDNGEHLSAANVIIKNIPMLQTNYDNLYIFDFITLLLSQNEWQSADALYNIIKTQGDNTLINNASYLFAQYHFERQHWVTTIELLADAINNLPFEEYNNALLMTGVSFQNLRKHRESVSYYEKISKDSKSYSAARLNMATAFVRQGWWTDAHIAITDLLRQQQATLPESSLNRLYLFLGYLFLNQEYYRDSREAFRNVSQSSIYTSKALLGISLSAANQEDYIGALNATRILKDSTAFDLTVAESYLLTPYYYEKLRQHSTASSGYTEAIAYYQSRIAKLNALISQNIKLTPATITDKHKYTIGDMTLDFNTEYPAHISTSFQKLEHFQPYLNKLNSAELNAEFDSLYGAYGTALQRIVRHKLATTIQQLTSYMDQARYGLARLYDNNLIQKP